MKGHYKDMQRIVYLCWQNDNTILGIADTEDNARKMCTEFSDSYMPVELNVACRKNTESTPMCTYNVGSEFLTYEEALNQGYKFS